MSINKLRLIPIAELSRQLMEVQFSAVVKFGGKYKLPYWSALACWYMIQAQNNLCALYVTVSARLRVALKQSPYGDTGLPSRLPFGKSFGGQAWLG